MGLFSTIGKATEAVLAFRGLFGGAAKTARQAEEAGKTAEQAAKTVDQMSRAELLAKAQAHANEIRQANMAAHHDASVLAGEAQAGGRATVLGADGKPLQSATIGKTSDSAKAAHTAVAKEVDGLNETLAQLQSRRGVLPSADSTKKVMEGTASLLKAATVPAVLASVMYVGVQIKDGVSSLWNSGGKDVVTAVGAGARSTAHVVDRISSIGEGTSAPDTTQPTAPAAPVVVREAGGYGFQIKEAADGRIVVSVATHKDGSPGKHPYTVMTVDKGAATVDEVAKAIAGAEKQQMGTYKGGGLFSAYTDNQILGKNDQPQAADEINRSVSSLQGWAQKHGFRLAVGAQETALNSTTENTNLAQATIPLPASAANPNRSAAQPPLTVEQQPVAVAAASPVKRGFVNNGPTTAMG